MSELKELLEKVKLENIMAFMIYGADSRRDAFENYEKEMKNPMMRFFIDWNIYTQKQIGKMINCLM